MIPLKTRVIQLLALGSTALGDIVSRVGGAEQDVIRVVNVVSTSDKYTCGADASGQVGRQVYPGSWGLQPAQYSKVKIASWKYTYAEKLRVVRLAREALDVLGLPVDADLRVELERKEAEVMSGASSSSSEEKASVPIPEPLPTPAKTAVVSPAPASAPISKKKTAQTLIGKQMAKFAKEKRASSMPNVKKADGTATPRTANGREHHSTSPVNDHRDREKAVEAEETKEKLEVGNSKRKRDEKEKRKSSPVYTSSESDAAPKRKRTPEYSSSSGDEPKRRRSPAPAPAKSHTRKPPTPELTLNGHTHTHTRTHVHAPTPRQPGRDPETMRDRYEELFPAYQQLTEKLARVHRAAEDGEDVGVGKEEVGKMVGKWGRWHAELAGIRVWFGEGEGS